MSMELDEYIFVSSSSTGLFVSGKVWTNSSFDIIGPGSFLLLRDAAGTMSPWHVDLCTGFKINPVSTVLAPPYLTPFVLGGIAQGDGEVQLNPLQLNSGTSTGAVQGWNYSPPSEPGVKSSAASGNGVWKRVPAAPSNLAVNGVT
jgi:hypothetical protein